MPRTLFILLTTFLLPALSQAFSNGPPEGVAGNPPARNTCVQCHNSFGLNSGQGTLSLLNLPEAYQTGETYRVTIELTDPNAMRWGFQITALDNQNQRAGEFSLVNRNETQLLERARQPQYVHHLSAGTRRGQRQRASWEVDWTAPADDIGAVGFYFVGNAANNNGATSGDRIYASSAQFQAAGPEPDRFTLTLAPGWNLSSSPVTPAEPALSGLLSELIQAGSLTLVRDRQGRLFNPREGVNDIGDWPMNEALQILVGAEASILFEGELRRPDDAVPLRAGWNWAPYLRSDTLSPVDAFRNIADVLVTAKDNEGRFHNPAYNYNYMGALLPGAGVMLSVSEDVEFVWPEPEGAAFPPPPPELRHFDAPRNTGRNLSLLVREWRNFQPSAGDEVALLTEDGLVAGASVVRDGDTPIVVWGDDTATPEEVEGLADGEEFRVRFWSAASDSEFVLQPDCLIRCEFFNYHTDEFFPIALAAEEPPNYVPEAPPSPETFTLSAAYPNPFNGVVSASVYLPMAGQVVAKVMSPTGRELERIVDGNLSAGTHALVWNAAAYPSGSYLLEVIWNGQRVTTGLTLIK